MVTTDPILKGTPPNAPAVRALTVAVPVPAATTAIPAPAAEALIEIEHVDFFYGGLQALHDITLNINAKKSPRSSVPPAAVNPRSCAASTV
jgi:ABC-type multidrug transport system fused ATPase/permease subunit